MSVLFALKQGCYLWLVGSLPLNAIDRSWISTGRSSLWHTQLPGGRRRLVRRECKLRACRGGRPEQK